MEFNLSGGENLTNKASAAMILGVALTSMSGGASFTGQNQTGFTLNGDSNIVHVLQQGLEVAAIDSVTHCVPSAHPVPAAHAGNGAVG